jgi:hypothetical protein
MHGRRIIIQTLHPASGTTCIIPPQELSHLVGGEKWAIVAEAPAAGRRAGDVGTRSSARQLELNLAARVRLTKAILNREIRRTVVECLKSRIRRRISPLISATTTQINPKIRSALYGRPIAARTAADRNPVGMEEGRNRGHPAARSASHYKTCRVRSHPRLRRRLR